MVGLSVVLEGQRDIFKKIPYHHPRHHHQLGIVNKGNMINSSSAYGPSPPPPSDPFTTTSRRSSKGGGFLDCCFLCKQKLLPAKDIYMYKGDRAFCSEECRCRQIFMDEEEIMKPKSHDNCSVAATSSSSSSSSSSPSARRKGAKNQPNGFAY